jgi:uncharacterized membrane protein YidH (DUF202 family)
MKSKGIGFTLIVIEIALIAYTSFNFITTEKIVDIGPIEISKEKNHFVSWSPFAGLTLVIGGIMVLVFSKKMDA